MSYRIVISGYYGFGNTGDEAVLAGILSTLGELDIDARVTVLSADPARTIAEHPGVEFVHRYRLGAVVRSMRGADLVVSGGGSLLQDVTSALSPRYYLFILNLARLLRRRTMVYAQGVGPLIRESTRTAVARALSRADAITVRDEDSKVLLESIGVTRVPIHLSADPSFLMSPDLGAADELLAAHGLIPGEFIGVALRSWPGDSGWLDQLAKGVAKAAGELGLRVIAIPMQEPDDVAACSRLDGAVVLSSIGGPRVVKGLIARCGLMVGMRLHSLIFGASEGVPFVPVVYDPKVASFAASVGAEPGLSIESFNSDDVCAAINSAWASRADASARLRAKAGERRDLALDSGRLMKHLLERRPGT